MAHTDHARPPRRPVAIDALATARAEAPRSCRGRRLKRYDGRGSRCNVILAAIAESAEAFA